MLATVVDFELWCPPFPDRIAITVLDAAELGALDPVVRAGLVSALQTRTAEAGVHVTIHGRRGVAPEGLLYLYDGWIREETGKPRRRGARNTGIVLARPPAEPRAQPADGRAVS